MAISKDIVLPNGVVINYHRIMSIQFITNSSNIINVSGYISKEKREEERSAIANAEPMDVYIDGKFIESPYDPYMNIIEAYEYLKTLPEYEGAEDILEEGQSQEIIRVLNL